MNNSKSALNTATEPFPALAAATAARYIKFGRFVHGFVRGKLLHDPVYHAILELNLLPEQGTVVDLGCGRGILLALLTTARGKRVFHGVELRPHDARIASETLDGAATIIQGNVCTEAIPACRVVFLLDVLLYIDYAAQAVLLQRIAQALQSGGLLVMREADAGAGWRYFMTWVGERFCALARGHWRQQYHYRHQADWIKLLEALGFKVRTYPMSDGTPFSNVLFIAQRNE